MNSVSEDVPASLTRGDSIALGLISENLKPSAILNKVWVTCYLDYITFHADFDVDNMLNKTGSFVVYITKQFTQEKQQPMELYSYTTFKPNYDNCRYSDFQYSIEKEKITRYFLFTGETHFKAYIKLYDENNSLLVTSDYVSFTINH